MSLRTRHVVGLAWVGLVVAGLAPACSSTGDPDLSGGNGALNGAGHSTGGTHAAGGTLGAGNGSSAGGTVGQLLGAGGNAGAPVFVGDPTTCEQAAEAHTYIGCDYWPTVTANNVWSIFDFAAVVANTGATPADVTVTRGGQMVATATVPPNGLSKVYLPWVPELKGGDVDECGEAQPVVTTGVIGGAYHLTSSYPVTVYQFSALEYQGKGGPDGKDWSSCPGTTTPCQPPNGDGTPIGCFSFSNDASLLLPSTAMTGNYRVTGLPGWSAAGIGAFITVTGTVDGTSVTVQMSKTGAIKGNAAYGVGNVAANGTTSFNLNAGDVLQLVAPPSADLSGSLVQATNPVQVIHGVPCIQTPIGTEACDHIESSVFPAETLGKHYLVTVPTGPNANVIGHVVRIYGNVDGTNLTYGSTIKNAPATINAGDVVSLGIVSDSFEVTGDHEFAVGSFMLGGALLDPKTMPPNQKGDPSQSLMVAVEQYRNKYIFLAPNDYDVSFADIVAPLNATVTLDGAPLSAPTTPIGSGNFAVARVPLGPGTDGVHVLQSDMALGLQVMGYGSYTSYQYPGGLNLGAIAPPPPMIMIHLIEDRFFKPDFD